MINYTLFKLAFRIAVNAGILWAANHSLPGLEIEDFRTLA